MKIALLLVVLWAMPALAEKAGEPPVLTSAVHADGRRLRQPAGQALPMPGVRRLRFEAKRGTWMSLDVSPGGKMLVFDLLGDLYVIPSAGGRATAITRGLAFDTQPTFSPDGRSLAFVSDRSGADNLWLSNPQGHHLRQLSFGDDDTVLVSPSWAPDGKSLYVSRYRPDLNNYELWRYALNGAQTLLARSATSRSRYAPLGGAYWARCRAPTGDTSMPRSMSAASISTPSGNGRSSG